MADNTKAPMDFPGGGLGGSADGANDLAKGLIDPVIDTFSGIPSQPSKGQQRKQEQDGGFHGRAV